MANILYITADFYIRNQVAGGMGTKTRALKAALGLNHNFEVTSEPDIELINLYDVVLIELLGFRKKKAEKFQEKIDALKACHAPKFVYGSDSEIFRWSGNELEALQEVVTAWIPNCYWQGDYFRDFDIPVTEVMFEPIDCDLFRPSENPKKIIVAGGAVSYEKQSNFFVELFSKLKEIDTGDYETAYVGSADGWGGKPKAVDYELQHHLKRVTDNWHGQIPPSKVAAAFGESAVGVLNPFYETCNRIDMEMLACALARACGPHVLYDERPECKRFITVDECIEVLVELTENWTKLPDTEYGETARQHALDHWSYEATCEQFNYILRGMN